MRCTVGTSREIRENSMATKNPLPRINNRLTPNNSHSITTLDHQLGMFLPSEGCLVQASWEAPGHPPQYGDVSWGSCVWHVCDSPCCTLLEGVSVTRSWGLVVLGRIMLYTGLLLLHFREILQDL